MHSFSTYGSLSVYVFLLTVHIQLIIVPFVAL